MENLYDPIYKIIKGQVKELGKDDQKISSVGLASKDHIVNFLDKDLSELEEILFRQEKILTNEKFLAKLPDRGEKLRKKHSELLSSIECAKDRKALCNIPEKLHDLNVLEWSGHMKKEDIDESETESKESCGLPCDENDPLLLLAEHHLEYPLRLSSRTEKEEKPLDDIVSEFGKLGIEDLPQEEGKTNSYHSIISKKPEVQGSKHNFKPFRPLVTTNKVSESSSESMSDISSSHSLHDPLVKLISMEESFGLTRKALAKQKGTVVKCSENSSRNTSSYSSKAFHRYRDLNNSPHFMQYSESQDDDDDDD